MYLPEAHPSTGQENRRYFSLAETATILFPFPDGAWILCVLKHSKGSGEVSIHQCPSGMADLWTQETAEKSESALNQCQLFSWVLAWESQQTAETEESHGSSLKQQIKIPRIAHKLSYLKF